MTPPAQDRMTVLVVGASGATGRLLVEQLLDLGVSVRVIVRPTSALPESLADRQGLTTIHAILTEISDADMLEHVQGCDAVASCLGHNMSFKGIYGQPRRLVTDATRRLCHAMAASKPEGSVKFVLMNTAGNRDRGLDERISFAEKCAIGLVRVLLPPHVDNEQAADFLRVDVGQDHQQVEWVVVRPDTLTDAEMVTAYDCHRSPVRSAIFNAGKTSRINVAHFMAKLITDRETWAAWKGSMPVIYNRE